MIQTKIRSIIALCMMLLLMSPYLSFSQNDSLRTDVEALKKAVTVLNRFKFSGYAQFQAQIAESKGQKSFSGGDFDALTNNRFMLRRGRMKLTYSHDLSKAVFQIDMTEKGVSVKDAYFSHKDPWTEQLTFTAGIFMRPFGQELDYSSSKRESPERSRLVQSLFPGERDLGFKIDFDAIPKNKNHELIASVGLINGTGPTSSEFDKMKDVIGQLYFQSTKSDSKINYRLGASFYNGGFILKNDTIYTSTSEGFKAQSGYMDDYSKRQYIGVDASISISTPIGLSTIKGEYITGILPGRSNSNKAPTSISSTILSQPIFERNFSGAYVYLIQDIGKSKHQLVFKYDFYDPNTDISGEKIGDNNDFNSYDISYSTLGIGYNYKINSSLKLMVYGDIVQNEKTSLSGLNKDLEDNSLTIRLQYKY